jgi:hypothetical protein
VARRKFRKKYSSKDPIKAENGRIGKDKESMTEKRSQRELKESSCGSKQEGPFIS